MAEPIDRVFLQVGTVERDHPWYECEPAGCCRELPGEPEPWSDLSAFTELSRPAVVLYRHERLGRPAWGVVWGPTVTGERDRMGRALGLRLLAEFGDRGDAIVFCSGVLVEWWPSREPGVTELGLKARQAVKEVGVGGRLMRDYFLERLKSWQSLEAPPTPPEVKADAPLLAHLDDERLQDLRGYLLGDFRRKPPAGGVVAGGFQAVVVVAERVVPGRLQGVWRAVTDLAPSDCRWASNLQQREPPAQSRGFAAPSYGTEEVQPQQPDLFAAFKRWWKPYHEPDAPDKGEGAKAWADRLRSSSPAERQEASDALVFRAKRDREKKEHVLNRLTELLADVSAHENVLLEALRTVELVVETGLEACTKLIREKLFGVLESFSCDIARQKDVRQRARNLLDRLRQFPPDKGQPRISAQPPMDSRPPAEFLPTRPSIRLIWLAPPHAESHAIDG